jgi:hypothetical protein
VRYLLEELPVFLDGPAVLGTATSTYCYPCLPEFQRQLYAGAFSLRPARGQARAIVTAAGGVADHARLTGPVHAGQPFAREARTVHSPAGSSHERSAADRR